MKYMKSVNGKLQTVYDIEEALGHVKTSYNEIVDENNRLRERIEYLESEKFKDVEIQKYKDAAERARKEADNGFPVPEYIMKKINKWQDEHVKKKHWDSSHNCEANCGAIGGRFIWEFQPTGIGTLISCKCGCGEFISEMDG